jgi:Domain of unknown function (DUF4283)
MNQYSPANEYAMLNLLSNDDNEDLLLTLSRSIIISDVRQMGALYIQAHMEKKYLVSGFKWVARAITKNRFLMDPPNPTWRATILELRVLDLGGIKFPVEVYNSKKHDFHGHKPVPIWIIIRGLPYRFFKNNEFMRIADDLSGGVLLDIDPRSDTHLDFSYLIMKVGVANVDVILPFRKMKFTDRLGQVTFHHLTYEINFYATSNELVYIDSDLDDNNSDQSKKLEKRKKRDSNEDNSGKKDDNTNNEHQGGGFGNQGVPIHPRKSSIKT